MKVKKTLNGTLTCLVSLSPYQNTSQCEVIIVSTMCTKHTQTTSQLSFLPLSQRLIVDIQSMRYARLGHCMLQCLILRLFMCSTTQRSKSFIFYIFFFSQIYCFQYKNLISFDFFKNIVLFTLLSQNLGFIALNQL